MGYRLVPHARLEPGSSISADGYVLIMQDDGNLVVYDNSMRAIWASGTKR